MFQIYMEKRKKLNPEFTPCTKTNCRYIMGLNVNGKSVKLLGRITKLYLHDLGFRE